MTDPPTVPPNEKDPEEDLIALLRVNPAQVDASVKIPVTVQCKKPLKHESIRVHPEWKLTVAGIEMKDDRDGGLYLVVPAMTAALQAEIRFYRLRPYITRAKVLRLWPIPLPDADGRQNEWHRSAEIAASLAERKWVRVTSNRDLGAYEVFEALNQPPDPEWPEVDLQQMLNVTFRSRGRIIENLEHPLVKQLHGRL
jgi:hypothetical protein